MTRNEAMNVDELSDYVTSEVGQEILGGKQEHGAFFYYVRTNQIRKLPHPTKQRETLYNRDDILKIKEKRAKKGRRKPTAPTLTGATDWVQYDDLPAILKLDLLAFQRPQVGDMNLYLSWLRRNPRLTFMAFAADNREKVLAYLTLLPLPESCILQILKGERSVTDIRPEEIETYERAGGYSLLASGVAGHPGYSAQINTVLRELMNYWCGQYPERYIERIYAQAATAKGDVLIQKLYFAPRYDLARNAYMLDLERPGASRFIRRLQQCIHERRTASQSRSIDHTR